MISGMGLLLVVIFIVALTYIVGRFVYWVGEKKCGWEPFSKERRESVLE